MADSIRVSIVAGAMQDTMSDIVARYVAANPGVEVTLELEPEGGVFQALIAAGNQPDMIITSFGPQLGTLAAQDAVVALDELEGAEELFARLTPRAVQDLYGHNYYVPVGADVTLMIYNRALFEEAGLDPDDPPTTWDEFLAAAEAIDNAGSGRRLGSLTARSSGTRRCQMGRLYWNMAPPI